MNHYRRRADIINRGYSGYTTEYILKMMPYLYPKNAHRNTLPIFATLMLGSNDATGSCDTFKHLTTDQYKSNLRKIIVYLKNLTSNPKIILLTPPPIGKQYQYPLNCSEKCCFGRGNSETEKYVKVVKEVGELFQIPTIDIYQRFLGVDNYSSLLYDGLHPNCLGNRIIFDEIVNTIEYISILLICNRKYYPDLSVNSTKLPYHVYLYIDLLIYLFYSFQQIENLGNMIILLIFSGNMLKNIVSQIHLEFNMHTI